jgi:hypothetical protein
VIDQAGNLARALLVNYSEFPNSCLRSQLALREDALPVLAHRRHRHLEEARNQRLRQPERVVGEPAFDPCSSILGLVQQELTGVRSPWRGRCRPFLPGDGVPVKCR